MGTTEKRICDLKDKTQMSPQTVAIKGKKTKYKRNVEIHNILNKSSRKKRLQLTLEQHGFELHGSIYMGLFFSISLTVSLLY